MSVISNNPGPLAADTSLAPLDNIRLLTDILMELRIHSIYLRQAFNITDEPGGLRNSMTLSDINNVR